MMGLPTSLLNQNTHPQTTKINAAGAAQVEVESLKVRSHVCIRLQHATKAS